MHLLFLIDVCPSVCPSEDWRNIAYHTGLLVIFFSNLVDWTCSRVLVQSTWNLFRSTVYELKLCTSYFWSMSIRSSVPQNGRNIAPHRVTSDFYGPPDGSQRAICFCLVRPSIHGSQKNFCLKTRFMGFWEALWCFWRFRFLSVRACVRALRSMY